MIKNFLERRKKNLIYCIFTKSANTLRTKLPLISDKLSLQSLKIIIRIFSYQKSSPPGSSLYLQNPAPKSFHYLLSHRLPAVEESFFQLPNLCSESMKMCFASSSLCNNSFLIHMFQLIKPLPAKRRTAPFRVSCHEAKILQRGDAERVHDECDFQSFKTAHFAFSASFSSTFLLLLNLLIFRDGRSPEEIRHYQRDNCHSAAQVCIEI